MNFDNMPELKSVWGYPLTLTTMLVIDVWLFFKFRKNNWL